MLSFPTFYSGYESLNGGVKKPDDDPRLEFYPFCLGHRWDVGARHHLMARYAVPAGRQRCLVWFGDDWDAMIRQFVHQRIICYELAHREGALGNTGRFALVIAFEGRLVLGQHGWQQSYPHEYMGDRHTTVTPIRAEMFKDGAAHVVNVPATSVLVEAPGHDQGLLKPGPSTLVNLVWRQLPNLLELMLQVARALEKQPTPSRGRHWACQPAPSWHQAGEQPPTTHPGRIHGPDSAAIPPPSGPLPCLVILITNLYNIADIPKALC